MRPAQKPISYVLPSTRNIPSNFNGMLEVTLTNGRKVLDSANANYSYGPLQLILKFALSKIYAPELDSILLLGLGGGSVVATLTDDFGFTGKITAVDIDPVIIRIAQDEFGITETENLRIECADAFDFVRQDAAAYALIIVDLFIDTVIPKQFLAADFWQRLGQKTRRPGHIIFNAFSEINDTGPMTTELTKQGFDVRTYHEVEHTNTILIASRP